MDRAGANIIAKVKELSFGVESKANDFKQLAETDKPDFLDLDKDGNTEEAMKDNENLDENTEFDISMDEFVYEKNQELIKYISSKTGVSEADAAAKAGQWLMKLAKGVNSVS